MDNEETHEQLAAAGLQGLDKSQQFAWQRAVETGTPFIIWKEGEAVDLNPATNGNSSYADVTEPEPAIVREEPTED